MHQGRRKKRPPQRRDTLHPVDVPPGGLQRGLRRFEPREARLSCGAKRPASSELIGWQVKVVAPTWQRDESQVPGYRTLTLLADGQHETAVHRSVPARASGPDGCTRPAPRAAAHTAGCCGRQGGGGRRRVLRRSGAHIIITRGTGGGCGGVRQQPEGNEGAAGGQETRSRQRRATNKYAKGRVCDHRSSLQEHAASCGLQGAA